MKNLIPTNFIQLLFVSIPNNSIDILGLRNRSPENKVYVDTWLNFKFDNQA